MSESLLGPLLRDPHGFAKLFFVPRHPDAPATAAGRRLEYDGYPISSAVFAVSSAEAVCSEPDTTGTPASRAIRRAADLLPIFSIAPAGGPTKVMPASSQAAANERFSARKP